jgi:hypothetical protein
MARRTVTRTVALYSVGVTAVPITVTVNGNQVTITLSSVIINGTVNGDGSLTITAPPDSSTGPIESGTLQRSGPNSFNQVADALNSTIAQDNSQAAQAQQQAQMQQQHSQDQQAAAGDTNSFGVRYALEQGIG